jgi:hypothetical protein
MFYRESSLIVSTSYLDFSKSISIVKEFLEISRVSLPETIRKLLFDSISAFFLLIVFSIVKSIELI